MAGDLAQRQAALVEQLRTGGVLTQPNVTAAFRAVPRHLFLPGVPAEEVYRDEAIPIKMEAGHAISSSSQPAMMAIMLEQLDVSPGQRLLEIGAGTGYNAALLGQLVGPIGQVVTVDIDDDIVAAARDHLAVSDSANVQVICGDGVDGYAAGAPYDRIILTVSASDLAPAWGDQLRPGGRLVLPLRLASGPQVSVAFDHAPPGIEPRFISRSVRPCAFMLLRGASAGPGHLTELRPGFNLETQGPPPTARGRIDAWLTPKPSRATTGLFVTELEAFGSLSLWLSLRAENLTTFSVEGNEARSGQWPFLFRFSAHVPMSSTIGLITTDGLALLDHSSNTTSRAASEGAGEQAPFELNVIGFGPQSDLAVRELVRLLEAWEADRRPSISRLRLRVYSRDAPYQAATGEVLVQKNWSKLVADWPNQAVVNV